MQWHCFSFRSFTPNNSALYLRSPSLHLSLSFSLSLAELQHVLWILLKFDIWFVTRNQITFSTWQMCRLDSFRRSCCSYCCCCCCWLLYICMTMYRKLELLRMCIHLLDFPFCRWFNFDYFRWITNFEHFYTLTHRKMVRETAEGKNVRTSEWKFCSTKKYKYTI